MSIDRPRLRPLVRRRFAGLALGLQTALIAATGGLALTAPIPAQAIPEAQAVKKLAVVPVFILTNEKGAPLPIPREKTLILPMYLERAKADQALADFSKANPSIKARVVALPMNVANEKITALSKEVKDGRTLIAPVIPADVDRQQAVQILKQQGMAEKEINEGLSIPVFFTKPFLTVKTPEGPRGVFFLSYADLQKALTGVPDKAKLQIQAADMTAVMREIIKAKDDSYVFFPTREYFRLVEEQKRNAAAPGSK
ncbi:Tic22 family protein [Synechococcus sp. CS-1328]|uniref:Tic22 family protein n=1 Tax=Synechococcus sp. CS-1328 TaxID=2847976 RepID=UPI00223ADE4C|nr:Tic22 family protein [Synechococcus sp. CS-1328]MCT0225160.1 hypothetical protein [Synechococcus sp. CS-1328]